jgi:hypothetical protein
VRLGWYERHGEVAVGKAAADSFGCGGLASPEGFESLPSPPLHLRASSSLSGKGLAVSAQAVGFGHSWGR